MIFSFWKGMISFRDDVSPSKLADLLVDVWEGDLAVILLPHGLVLGGVGPVHGVELVP